MGQIEELASFRLYMYFCCMRTAMARNAPRFLSCKTLVTIEVHTQPHLKEEPQNIIDASSTKKSEASIVKDMIVWWEKKRLIYNILIIGLSLFLMIDFWDHPMRSIIGTRQIVWNAFVFIFGANLFYTLGWGLGVVSHYIFKTKGLNNTSRWILFVLGTLFSIVWTVFYFVVEFDVVFAN